MLARYSFITGAAMLMRDFEVGGDYRAMLLTNAWTPSPTTDVFVADVSAAEFTDASYAREVLANMARVIDPANEVATFTADPLTFGVIAGGEIAAWLALFAFVTNDADSPLVSAYAIDYTADGIATGTFTAADNVVFRFNSTCPADFS